VPQARPTTRRPRRDESSDRRRVGDLVGPSLSVLCVDDHASFLAGVRRLFERQSWQVLTAIDGRSAVARAQAQRFDVWLLDLRLPDFSGIEVVRKLRGEGISTPAIILTAYPEAKSTVAATRLGLEYLAKTETRGSTLVDAIRTAANQSSVTPEEPSSLTRKLQSTISAAASLRFGEIERKRHWTSLAEVILDPTASLAEFMTATEALRILSDESIKGEVVAQFLRRLAGRLADRERTSRDLELDSFARLSSSGLKTEVESSLKEAAELIARRVGWKGRLVRLAGVMRLAAAELAFTNDQVAQIGYRLSYEHHSVFDRDFRQVFGVSPRSFRTLLRC
jgi:two-component system OmpR family response regulator